MDNRYTVPGRAVIRKEVDKVVIELKAKTSSFLLLWHIKAWSARYLHILEVNGNN